MSDPKQELNEERYAKSLERRKKQAQRPFEEKIEAVIRLQHIRYELAKAAGRPCPKPWHWKGD